MPTLLGIRVARLRRYLACTHSINNKSQVDVHFVPTYSVLCVMLQVMGYQCLEMSPFDICLVQRTYCSVDTCLVTP